MAVRTHHLCRDAPWRVSTMVPNVLIDVSIAISIDSGSFSLTSMQESSARSVKQERFAQIESGIKLVGVFRAQKWRYQK
ncbi:MAG: hypothetical protein RIG63_03105 [Coleofasciculus chthonoplastes F3-SA18-01]|uniref:hypothetical protein n=1 Tax=Coleofasciculus chthonoplastes TaxID=64178 RepID=UPI0032FA5945